MFLRVLLTICFLSLGLDVCSSQQRFPGSRLNRPTDTVDPKTVTSITSVPNSNRGGIPRIIITPNSQPTALGVNARAIFRQTVQQVNNTINQLERSGPALPSRRTTRPLSFPFGPHLLTTPIAQSIGRSGRLFVETAVQIKTGVPIIINSLTGDEKRSLECPFSVFVSCDHTAPYRTITGACNNLGKPLWGKSNTPFERSLPAVYDDGVSSPRSRGYNNLPLPLPRKISTTIHEASGTGTLDTRFTQITMEFGQFVSHDIERFAAIQAPDGSELVCCQNPSELSEQFGCLPIEIPGNDPFFAKYGRRCMEFVRALSTPNLDCELGVREQLNQESAYLDGSAVYGSTDELAGELRTFSQGLLKTTPGQDGELPLQDNELRSPECRSQAAQKCFKCGDPRVNQQPALMSMHTLWLREHNRVARRLASINPSWSDEKLYQEARKIVSAEFQHVVYDEFLPAFVGPYIAKAFDFPARRYGYNSDYDSSINAQIRSSFSAAGYRVGHTLVQRLIADSLKFKDHFLRPDTMYSRNQGTSFVIQNLFMKKQQKCDRLISPQLLNTLFEQAPGTGIDLAATNLQRGRDFGIPSYNAFRQWCGLPRATHFGTGYGGLVNHSPEAARLLSRAYRHVDDIDLWTGGISEKILFGAVIGPTMACVVGRQFFLLKKGDRFFYENDDKYAKFSLEKLDQIRKTSLSRIICDNTNTNHVQREAFKYPDYSNNPTVRCDSIPKVDLSAWGPGSNCIDGGWSAWTSYAACRYGYRFRFRRCNNPTPSSCGRKCSGPVFEWIPCFFGRNSRPTIDPVTAARMVAPKDIKF